MFALLGFSREFLFVNINNQLYKLYYGHSSLPLPDSLSFLSNLNYTTIYYGKFPLTIAFYIAYFFTSYFAVKMAIGTKKITVWVIYIYALLLILAALIMTYNYIINNQLDGDEYTFSRWLLGIAQSPLVTFFLIASGKLYQKIQPENPI